MKRSFSFSYELRETSERDQTVGRRDAAERDEALADKLEFAPITLRERLISFKGMSRLCNKQFLIQHDHSS